MARPARNTVDYFPHYLSDGKKMFFIESKYGNDGYSTWFRILETLAKTENHYLNLNSESELMYLSAKCKISENILLEIINDLSKLGVFDKNLWANKIIFCQKFIESIEDAYKKRNNQCITLTSLGILLTSLGILKPDYCTLKVSDNPQSKVKYSKVDNTKEKEKYDFYLFWDLYPTKIGKAKCEPKWNNLKKEEQELILNTLPKFIRYKPFESYKHPHPETYFNQKRWNDEFKENVVPTPKMVF